MNHAMTRFESAAWPDLAPGVRTSVSDPLRIDPLAAGQRGGLGRSGTVAARMLVELDVPGREAIARIRGVRPGAIETSEQLRYIAALAGR